MVTRPNSADMFLECGTCSFQHRVTTAITSRVECKRKGVDDVLGGAAAWENVERTAVKCVNPKCRSGEAYFRQLQTRSADEPMTTFYRCVDRSCGTQWKED